MRWGVTTLMYHYAKYCIGSHGTTLLLGLLQDLEVNGHFNSHSSFNR